MAKTTTSCVVGCVPIGRRGIAALTSLPGSVAKVIDDDDTVIRRDGFQCNSQPRGLSQDTLEERAQLIEESPAAGAPAPTAITTTCVKHRVNCGEDEKHKTIKQPYLLRLNVSAQRGLTQQTRAATKTYRLRQGITTLGSFRASVSADISLYGEGIQDNHAHISVDGSRVTLYPLAVLTSVDGLRVSQLTVLCHGNLVLFGHCNYFRFYADSHHPNTSQQVECDASSSGDGKHGNLAGLLETQLKLPSNSEQFCQRDKSKQFDDFVRFEVIPSGALNKQAPSQVRRHSVRPLSATQDRSALHGVLRHVVGLNTVVSVTAAKKVRQSGHGFLETPNGDLEIRGLSSIGVSVDRTGESFNSVDWLISSSDSRNSLNDESDAGIVSADSLSSTSSLSDDVAKLRSLTSIASYDSAHQQVVAADQSGLSVTKCHLRKDRHRDGLSDLKAAILASATAKLSGDNNHIYVTRNLHGGCEVIHCIGTKADVKLHVGTSARTFNNEQIISSEETFLARLKDFQSPPGHCVELSYSKSKPHSDRFALDHNRNQNIVRRSFDSVILLDRSPTSSEPHSGEAQLSNLSGFDESQSLVPADSSVSESCQYYQAEKTVESTESASPNVKHDVSSDLPITSPVELLSCSRSQVDISDAVTVVSGDSTFSLSSTVNRKATDTEVLNVADVHVGPEKVEVQNLSTTAGSILPVVISESSLQLNSDQNNVCDRQKPREVRCVECENSSCSTASSETSCFDTPDSRRSSPDRSRRVKKFVTFAAEEILLPKMEVSKELAKNNNHQTAPVAENVRTYLEIVEPTTEADGKAALQGNGCLANNNDFPLHNSALDHAHDGRGPSSNEAFNSYSSRFSKNSESLKNDVRRPDQGSKNDDFPVNSNGEDDVSSVDEFELDDMSSSQRDLRLLYRQRRAERLQEQEAAEREKQRLEEILQLCSEFGLDTDMASPTGSDSAVASSASSASEKIERRNSVGKIKTNGSLTKIETSLPTADRVVSLAVGELGSNSDDDVDRGTIKRRPVASPSPLSKPFSTSTGMLSRTARSPPVLLSRFTASKMGSADFLQSEFMVTRGGSLPRTRKLTDEMPLARRNQTVESEFERPMETSLSMSSRIDREYLIGGEGDHHLPFDGQPEWYPTTVPDYVPQWTSTKSWKSHQHKVLDLRLQFEALRDLRSEIVQSVADTKQKILEIETRQTEALRELKMERALLEGEQQIQLEQLDSAREKVAALEAKEAKLLKEAASERSKVMESIEREKEQLQFLEQRFEETTKAVQACDDHVRLEMLRRRSQEEQDVIDNQRFLVDNLEFQQLEDESHYDDEKEIIQKQLKIEREELMMMCEQHESTLQQISSQQDDLTQQVDSTICDLEKERHLLAELQKKDGLAVYRIDQQLRELSNMLPEYSVDGYGAYVDDDDDDEEGLDQDEDLVFDNLRQAPIDFPVLHGNPNLSPISRNPSTPYTRRNTPPSFAVDPGLQKFYDSGREYHGMRYGSLPNWDRVHLEHSATPPAPFDGWTNVMSESEDSSRSGSEPHADRNQIIEEQREKMRSTEHLLMLAQAEKMRLLAEQEQQREADREALKLERKRRRELERRLVDEMKKHNEMMEQTIKLRDKHKVQARPLTRYLPVRDAHLNLEQFVASAGHNADACAHIILTTTACRGYLAKLGGRLRTWKRRWFVFDRASRSLCYYSDRTEARPPRGIVYFQAIEDVFVDHMGRARSPTPQLTFCIKTNDRAMYLVSPSADAMRIWVDVIFTGAEGYREFA